MYHFDEARCLDWFRQMIAIDSTTSQFREIQDWLCGKLDEMGFAYHVTRKGGVIIELGGEGRPLCVTAHLDDIGLMVRRVNPDGTLNVLLKTESQAVTPAQMGLRVSDGGLPLTLINDGTVERDNLKKLGMSEEWLCRELRSRGCTSPSQVSYMNIDELGRVFLQEKDGK